MAPPFDGLFISVSQIKTYLRCPRQFELRYVRGEPAEFIPGAFALGSAVHAALAYAYGMIRVTSSLPIEEAVRQVLADVWGNITSGPVPVRSAEETGEDDLLAKGEDIITLFLRHLGSSEPPEVEAVEADFSATLHDPITGEVLEEKLVGVMDLILREGGRRVIVEHKTSARRYSEDQLQHELQATAYYFAGRQLGLGDAGLRYQIFTKTRTPSVQVEEVVRDESNIDDFLHTTTGILRAVDAGVFYPVRGWQCRTCPYAEPCSRMSRRSSP